MKRIASIGVVSLLLLSGVALGVQPEEQKGDSPVRGMMDRMNKGEQGMDGDRMMRMMKMMDQCSAMMDSAQKDAESEKR
ncbi:MAG TPA: hypothetical protein VNO43_06930 [Candidatus Eisenbacteria bacterium]|nr:hypothetical protein [Candidatus Eisenbacteria bacterium]